MNAANDLKWVLWMLVVLFLAWLITGGPGRSSSRMGLFLKPPAPLGSDEVYGPTTPLRSEHDGQTPSGSRTGSRSDTQEPKTPEEIRSEADRIQKEIREVSEALKRIESARNESGYKGKVTLDRAGAGTANVGDEYLRFRISTEATGPIVVTGWKVVSAVSGKSATIGQASGLLYQGDPGLQNITAAPGDTIVVATGRSPKGVSFRVNTCSGYFEQFQDFTPSLDRDCPLAISGKLPKPPNQLPDACLDYIEQIPRCVMVLTPPEHIAFQCGDYIINNINYNTCVADHKNDPGFWKKEWRVYLSRDATLWKGRREVITLLDRDGKIVDSVSY